MNRRGSPRMRALVALWLLASTGCGGLPTEPLMDSNPTSSPPMAAEAPAPEDVVAAPAPETVIVGTDGVETTATVSGSSGGTLRAANVSVRFPKNAFTGTAEIKVTVPTAARMLVQLEIDPPSKNSFAQPVKLEFDARAAGNDPRGMQVVWFDPVADRWVQIPYTIDAATGKVTAELQHFSLYDCISEVAGRAGW